MNLCEMWDGPVPLAGAAFEFAILAALAAVAGWCRASKSPNVRFLAKVTLGFLLLGTLFNAWKIWSQWGLSWDSSTCKVLHEGLASALLIVFTLLVAGSAVVTQRIRVLVMSRKPDQGF